MAQHTLQELQQALEAEFIRMEGLVLLAGMLGEGSDCAGPLADLLEEDTEQLALCFPGLPAHVLQADDPRALREAFMTWAWSNSKLGFAINFSRPMKSRHGDGTMRFSWGIAHTTWLYGDTLDEALERGLAWAAEREAADCAPASLSAVG